MENLKTVGVAVVSSARKLIFKVPNGPVVVFPEGVVISPYGQNNESPVIVVHNQTDTTSADGTWQGADSENGIVILNLVPEEVAVELLEYFSNNPTIEGLNNVLLIAEANGCVDQYTTKTSFVDSKLSPAGLMLDEYTGIVKRDDKDLAYIGRNQDGTIARLLGDDLKHIDTDEILLETYVLPDGSPIDVTAIPYV